MTKDFIKGFLWGMIIGTWMFYIFTIIVDYIVFTKI